MGSLPAGMRYKGTFSYSNDDVSLVRNVDNGLDLRIERINQNVARVCSVDHNGNLQPMPAHITMQDGFGASVVPHNNEFLIVWGDSSSVSVHNQVVVKIDVHKQQAIMARDCLVHETIQM